MTFSRHKSIRSKFISGVVKTPPDNFPFVYRHNSYADDLLVKLPQLENELVEWCETYCRQPWAWWFDTEHGYIGFSSQEELMQFRLSV